LLLSFHRFFFIPQSLPSTDCQWRAVFAFKKSRLGLKQSIQTIFDKVKDLHNSMFPLGADSTCEAGLAHDSRRILFDGVARNGRHRLEADVYGARNPLRGLPALT
jgi:hypothetical protein